VNVTVPSFMFLFRFPGVEFLIPYEFEQ
jgi:hypothetical protein